MDDLVIQNSHALRRVIADLIRGREKVVELQNLLDNPVGDHGAAEDLAVEIVRSFAESLSALSSGAESTRSPQISAVDGGDSACSDRSKKRPAAGKNRRGCYKRRRTGDIWEKITEVGEDGYVWRKYGQKNILNSVFPRCYYRCTHKPQGCKAKKQVQQMKQGCTLLYQTTYFNRHVCTQTPSLPVDAHPLDHQPAHLLSFQVSNDVVPSKSDDQCPRMILAVPKPTPTLKDEEGDDVDQNVPDAKDAWREIVGSGLFGFDHLWDPTVRFGHEGGGSCGSTASWDGLDDMQLADLETFHFDDITF